MDCLHDCHCLNNTACVVYTGHCTDGCADDWSGPSCQSESIEVLKLYSTQIINKTL